ncbi:hypothetical protein [uncultured Thomasclavelia sp.]|uniref:hypothetical protein n=1 Tax=uncultured Thomasclavelia sp. TaxID=3025759 RepID=UPI0035A60130
MQWLPDHHSLISKLINHLNPEGVLAIQIPINQEEPLYKIIQKTVDNSPYDFHQATTKQNDTLVPEEYSSILSSCCHSFDIFETIYYHELPTHSDLLNWVKGTRLRSYLDCLNF